MTAFTTQAYLIHKQAQGDTSLYLHCFTHEKGLLSIRYRGGRATKKSTQAALFCPLWCSIYERQGVYYLNALEARDSPLDMKGIVLFCALYLNELLFYTIPPDEQEEALFFLYEKTLIQLSQAKENIMIEMLLRRFEIQLLQSIGYGLTMLHDIMHKPIEADKIYRYQAGQGFTSSPTGFYGSDILAIAEDRFETAAHRLAAKRILRQAITHLLDGRKLVSRDLLKFWSKR